MSIDPCALIGRLAALVPPKGLNGVRYHVVIAPESALRSLVIPRPTASVDSPEAKQTSDGVASVPEQVLASRPRRIAWAALLAWVFLVDVLFCDTCQGRMKPVAFVQDPSAPSY